MPSNWFQRHLGPPQPLAPSGRPAPAVAPQPQQPQAYAPALQSFGQPQAEEQVTVDNLASATMRWKGGKATSSETTPCPHCGGNLFFSRMNLPNGGRRTVPPAPHCMECGYKGDASDLNLSSEDVSYNPHPVPVRRY